VSRPDDLEQLITISVDCGFHIHKDIGPGLLESVYQKLMVAALIERGLSVASEVAVPLVFKGVVIDNALRADLIVESRLLIELKSTERNAAVHGKQVLTYLRLLRMPVGLLFNFGQSTFKEGLQRIANGYRDPPGLARHLSALAP
jgi:GxxExxY protein